ncbi:solute carrier family 12 member 8 isoform X6 [Nycticebus coucang]|uniref:solute carrier family 12 member 8 isoform X6 n=1 Tax=Nycticebus coucang TaxID=9470 RepID=UPI00234C5E05|nr:solute carrier family 12 member 8 isoform X6 [Nycticebus coucang]
MSQVQELFHEAAQQGVLAQPQPWWKIQLFVWEPVLFGTWDGVFTSCMINIFGVVLFLRTGWLVGNTGVLVGMFLVSFVVLVALVTVLSGIGVGEHGGMGSGGVYSMISSVLGGQMGGTIGLLYVFGQNMVSLDIHQNCCGTTLCQITALGSLFSLFLGFFSRQLQVSLVGFLFLLGLYISSLASCMGGLYGAPRILQCIAQEKVIPALACLGKGKGPNKTPIAAICLTSLVTMAFVLVGQVNVLAPIVTINFMLTYVAVDYSYFSLSMGPCSLPQVPEPVLREDPEALRCSECLVVGRAPSYGSEGPAQSVSEGTLLEFTKDMDQLLQLTRRLENSQPRQGEVGRTAERQTRKHKKATKQTLQDSFLLDLQSPDSFPTESSDRLPTASLEGQESSWNEQTSRSEGTQPGGTYGEQRVPKLGNQYEPSGEDFFLKSRLQEQDVHKRPTSFYTQICNPWVSLLGAVGSLLIMFVIQWVYTLVNMGVAAIVYFYIGRTSPGLHLGSASNFSFFRWMRSLLIPSCRSLRSSQEQIILAPSLARLDMEMTQLTQENADFATRDRYHHSSFVSREQLMPQY